MFLSPSTLDQPLRAARAALARGDWTEARAGFEAALRDGQTAEAWEGLSWAAWWLDDEATAFAARERAFRAHRAAGDLCGAARMAAWLASDALDFRGDAAVAAGWLERARQLLEGQPRSCEHGWLAVMQGHYTLNVRGEPEAAAALAREAVAIGRETAVADLEAIGLALEGIALVVRGRVEEGMRRLDTASAVAAGEEFQLPISPAWALCILISACEGVGDFARAAQWTSTMRALGDRWHGRQLVGVCRSAYGTVLATRGDWDAAETELVAAVDDLEASRPAMAASGLVRLGELRARQGRTDEARALFARAHPHELALVGLGTLALDDGDAEAAADAAERVLRRVGADDVLHRVPGLKLLVRARTALGDLDAAASACAQLEDAAERLRTPYMQAHARLAAGELAAARGDLAAARRACEDAVDRFTECAAPYDAALARVALARVLAALGRGRAAEQEAAAAGDVLAALGAARDVARAEAAAAGGPPARRTRELEELTAREIEVLRLVAQGLGDADIAERLVVSPHTVHRHVANVRTKLGLPSRAAAVGWAARAGLL
jgi:ATP/maltotriose-dependent transcriptional regulator MalT